VQRPRLEAIGWVDRFDAIVIGGEVGLSKPDPAYFAYAHDLIGQPRHESVLVVGDSLSADIAGALRFGYTACWYNPEGHALPDDERPHHTVSHLKDVMRSEEHTSELQSRENLVCRLLLEKKNNYIILI